ncbi:Peroxisomal membrane protein PEX14 [Phytophthora citrophthora]|uniref:Peroxisomal membrane protein PEX14 n=1 Tax=Phytophthora citrophthora TaxID=4793 RepID=A0AAD9LQ09_9STRA|nr:Peroxisomal membrane protein PEX14 [Phytophthora citrophthora]
MKCLLIGKDAGELIVTFVRLNLLVALTADHRHLLLTGVVNCTWLHLGWSFLAQLLSFASAFDLRRLLGLLLLLAELLHHELTLHLVLNMRRVAHLERRLSAFRLGVIAVLFLRSLARRGAVMAMREEMVENGLKFLQHPSVQSTPLSERVSFLEGKGMTKEEIQEAIERHQNGGTAAIPAPTAVQSVQPQLATAAPMMMTAAAPMQMMQRRARYPAYVRVLWTVSSLVGAASILTFLWNYAVQSGYIPWLRPMPPMLEAAKVQEEKEQEAKKDEALLAELSSVSAAIQKQTEELGKLSASLDEKERDMQSKTLLTAQISSSLAEQGNAQSIAELKAEISTLKALLLSKKTANASENTAVKDTVKESGSAADSKATEPTTPSVSIQAPAVVSEVSKAERMEKALKKLRTENSLEQLKLAAGILSMYVKNLVENPDVPRYRRIAPGNANFKQKIEPLKHHEELLKSIGFETTGLNMEWKWHTASKTTGAFEENIAILRALLKALQSLSSPKSSSNLSLEEIAHASLKEFYANKDKTETEGVASTSTTTTTVTTIEEKRPAMQSSSSKSLFGNDGASSGPASTSLDAFMARLEQQTSVNNFANVDVKTQSTTTSSSHIVEAGDDEEKMPVPIAPTVTAGGPAYPESFKEVMDLIQKGETVPGIRDIEDKLSVDSSALLSQQTKTGETTAKPWEKIKA